MQRERSLIDLATQAFSLSLEEFLRDCPYPVLVPEAVSRGALQREGTGGTQVHRVDIGESTIGLESAKAILVRKDPNLGRSSKIQLGRTAATDIRVVDHSVSKNHLYFRKVPGGDWMICDQGSRNGTFIGGRRLLGEGEHPLRCGDTLQVGRIRLVFLTPAGLMQEMRRENAGS